MKGKPVSEKTKEKLRSFIGNKTSNWKGGKPKCPDCNKEISYEATYCNSCKVKHFTPEHRKKLNKSLSDTRIGKMPKNTEYEKKGKFGNVVRGWFDINGKKMFFRSKWEANYARYLDFLVEQKQILKWDYEKDVFIFHAIQFGTRSYRPDFRIFNLNGSIEYHEIKGYMDRKSATKIKRMAKYYPEVKLIVVEKTSYRDIYNKVGRICGFV